MGPPGPLERLHLQLLAAVSLRLEPREARCSESEGSRPQRRLVRTPSFGLRGSPRSVPVIHSGAITASVEPAAKTTGLPGVSNLRA